MNPDTTRGIMYDKVYWPGMVEEYNFRYKTDFEDPVDMLKHCVQKYGTFKEAGRILGVSNTCITSKLGAKFEPKRKNKHQAKLEQLGGKVVSNMLLVEVMDYLDTNTPETARNACKALGYTWKPSKRIITAQDRDAIRKSNKNANDIAEEYNLNSNTVRRIRKWKTPYDKY